MKISLNWLNTYLDRPVEAEEAVDALTHAGFPVEEWERIETGGGDAWLDVEVTSNRGDCLSHVGVAREVAVATGRKLELPDCELTEAMTGETKASDLATVKNEKVDWCPVYTARVVRGVKVGPSPKWLVDALAAIGQPSVSNVVDVTNYVLHELGQPLHAFDMKLLQDSTIVVRAAKDGELITAIDGTKHKLSSRMLVIADSRVPVAVAGVMGGLDTEINEQTTDVLLEAAIFDPLVTRRTSRMLKLFSDSSYRFERGIDPLGVDRASRRAAKLIVELAGGKVEAGIIRVGVDDPPLREVTMRLGRCRQLLGIEIPVAECERILRDLGLSPGVDEGAGVIACTVPSYRLDIAREVDLFEEIARHYGLSKLAVSDRIEIVARSAQPQVAAKQKLGEVLVGHGYHEAVTFSFVNPKQGEPWLAKEAKAVMIEDERRKSEPMLRPSLAPSLMVCRKVNQDVGNAGVKLFETAATWGEHDGTIVETEQLGLLCDAEDRQLALRDMRGSIEELVQVLMGEADVSFEPQDSARYEAGARVLIEGQAVGELGVVSAAQMKLFDLQTPVCVATFELVRLLGAYPPERSVSSLARFPGIERDLSVIVDESVQWRQIREQVDATCPEKLERVSFITTYRGRPVPKGRKSVSFRMVYRDPAKTLRHEEVDPQVESVVSRLREKLGAELRG